MKTIARLVFAAAVAWGSFIYAQTCIVPAPAKPPRPREGFIRFTNPDGGARPCFAVAVVLGGAAPKEYQISNAKCDTSMGIFEQAAANDNGWNDGGAP